MNSADGEHFTNQNENTCIVPKTVISRVFKYVNWLNYKHLSQFPTALEHLSVLDFGEILIDTITNTYMRPFLEI